MKLIKVFSIFILLPALLAGRIGIIQKKTSFYKQNYKFVSRSPEKTIITSQKRNLNPPSNENNSTLVACSPQAIITPGVVVKGDTTREANKFSGADYPGLGWDEAGPDFVYQITIPENYDFRIHIDPDPNILPDLDIILIDNTGGSCNTANWIFAGDHTIIYPDAPAGTYYIIVDGYTKDDAGPYTLYTACAKDLLIIDADGSGTSGPKLCGANYCTDVWANSSYGTNYFYKTAIEGISPAITYSYWDKTLNGGKLPEESTLYSYKSIIWFSGQAWGDSDPNTPSKIITQDDEELLRKYLNLGGRVAIIGQDILWDYTTGTDGRLPDGSILNDYFQINSVYNDVWNTNEAFNYDPCSSTIPSIPIWGVPGNPLGDNFGCDNSFYLFCAFKPSNGAPFHSWIDSIYSRYAEPAFDTYWKSTNDKTTLPAGIRYSASLGIMDWFKTAFFAFSPETNYWSGDTTTVITRLRALLKRTLDWFEEDSTTVRVPYNLDYYAYFDDTTLGNGNGMPEPGETFDLIFGAQNNTSYSISLKAYEGFEDWYTTLPAPWCKDLGKIANGNSSEVSFQMTLDSSTPIGYRFTPLINVSQYYDETFEGASGFDYAGWQHYPINGTTDWVWTNIQSQSPTHSWFAQDVSNVNDKVLESPIIYVKQFTTLSFYHKYTFEGSQTYCYDGGTIEYATGPDFTNWTVIPDSWFLQNGFNGTVSSNYGNPIGGKRAYCGSQSTWYQTIIDLSPLAGKDVRIRWHEGDDNSTGSTGWYVDSITIPESYNTTVGFGLFVGQANVMLVKDEYWLPNTTAVDMYEQKIKSIQNPLTGQNYTVAQWDTSVFAAPTYNWYGLSNDRMKNYQFVVWFTGFDFIWTLTPNPWETSLGIDPEAELSYFLQNKYSDTGVPARLILSSQDYLYDKYNGRNTDIPQNDFARVHLKVNYVEQDYIKDTSTMLKGIDGIWVSEKMNMSLNNDKAAGAYFKNYADLISADLSEDGTEYVWTYNLPASFSATQNLKKDRNSRFLFMPFAFENLQDGTPDGFPSKKRFLEKVMCQMMMSGASSYPPCGYSRPYPAYSFTIYGIKQGTSDAYFYWSSPGSFTNCAYEEISGFYRIYGALNNPNRASFSLLSKTGQETYLGTEDVPAGSCFYYELRDWVDAFDIPAVSSCP